MWYKYRMERGLTQELASELKKQIAENEDWLIKRILYYAKNQGYTAYTSTLEEAWRASVAGLSKPILDTPSTSFLPLELNPHSDFMNDAYAEFGVLEAKKHRERGIDLIMFLGLFKYYRQTYEDLLFKLDMSAEDIKSCRTFLKRYFDRVELGFIDEWIKVGTEGINQELAIANRRLVNEKSMYLTTFESLKQPVVVVNGQGETIVMNQSAAELFAGFSTPGAVYYGGQHPEIHPAILKNVKEFLGAHHQSKNFTQAVGDSIFDVTFTRMKDVSGKFIGLAVIMNDITDKRRTESVLEESETLRKAFMEGIDAAALVLDMEAKSVVDFNSKVVELFTSKIADRGFTEECPLFYEEMGGAHASIFELAEASVSNEERLLEMCEAGMKPVRLFTIEVWFQNRRHKIVIIFDITREKMLERRANHIQHLEVLGDIAGSLPDMLGESAAHLQETMEQAYYSIKGGCDGSVMLSEISRAVDGANSINEIIGALASIVQYDTETAQIDMNQLVKNCVLLTKDKWHPYADVDMQLGGGARIMKCCPDEIGQIFLNLMMNSAYAVRKKSEAEGSRGVIRVSSRYSAAFYEVKIGDTGIGIKKQDYKRIFDQGFSTKEVGRVTGNGLAIVYDLVVRRYKGTIEFKSVEGKGTEFTVRLPLT